MPHIIIETSDNLAGRIDWQRCIPALHEDLAAPGWCALSDLKSRVHGCRFTLCGNDPQTEQIVATLLMTNPRSKTVQDAMAATVLRHITAAINGAAIGNTQICVFLEYIPKSRYRRHDLAG